MPKHGKKYLEAGKKIESDKLYAPDAVSLLRDVAFASFDETIEVHARLGIDPRQADQTVRSTVVLPFGTGKTVRVLVFAAGEAERVARRPAPIMPASMIWCSRFRVAGWSSTPPLRWQTRWARSAGWDASWDAAV